jgi:hypothetical protein
MIRSNEYVDGFTLQIESIVGLPSFRSIWLI